MLCSVVWFCVLRAECVLTVRCHAMPCHAMRRPTHRYALVAYYFSSKMSRLMILMGPIAAVLTGVTVGSILHMTVAQVVHVLNEAPKKKTKAS